MPDQFTELMGELDYPMLVVTVATESDRAGCLVGFATQTSIHPPRFLVGLSVKNRTYRVARDAERLAVHFVPAERQDLAQLFGGETGDDVDKFDRCEWEPGPHGLPLIDGCPNRFTGRILDRIELGDHVGFVLEPEDAWHGATGPEFTFHRAKRIEPGHEP